VKHSQKTKGGLKRKGIFRFCTLSMGKDGVDLIDDRLVKQYGLVMIDEENRANICPKQKNKKGL
jgi:hypothetical protein